MLKHMCRPAALVAALLAGIVIAGPPALAQPTMMIVVLDAAGQPHVFFQPRAEPLANPEASVPPVTVPVGRDGRMPDGASVAGDRVHRLDRRDGVSSCGARARASERRGW